MPFIPETPAPLPADDESEESEESIPEPGTIRWLQYVSEADGLKPTPIPVSITGSIRYYCPELQWYNFDIFPHKIKMTNTGFTVVLGAKWRTERPYVVGGPFLEKHIFSQVHFHWGRHMMEGSDHIVDNRAYPAEMQVTFFAANYLNQEEAIKHPDGLSMFCYLIKHGVEDDPRLAFIIDGFKRIKYPNTTTRIGPKLISTFLPMFSEDYFMYWGALHTAKGEDYAIKWIVPRCVLSASDEQMKQFRSLYDCWDEPAMRNFRPVQPRQGRNVFFISPHWSQYNSLLPIPRILPEPSISIVSQEYMTKLWMLPEGNADLIPKEEEPPPESTFKDNDEFEGIPASVKA